MLTALVSPKTHTEWLQQFHDCTVKENATCIEKEMNPVDEILSMGEVIKALNELTEGNAIIVTDVGQHQMVACRYAKMNQTKSNITSGGLGTMGFA